MSEFVRVASVNEIPEQQAIRVEVHGRCLCIVNLGGTYYAIDDMCTHAEASLADGEIVDDEIICPLHFASFNVKTGQCLAPPADEDVQTFPVRVNGNDIEVQI